MTEKPRLPDDPAPESRGPDTEGGKTGDGGSPIPEDALFDPEGPIVLMEGEIPEDAIFSPDDPISRPEREGEGVVTGMAGRAGEERSTPGTLAWDIRRTANILGSLARSLEKEGVEALRIHPHTEPMDAMLRSFVAGYLVGRTELKD